MKLLGGDHMKLTVLGKDYIILNEFDLKNSDLSEKEKIHLIKINIKNPELKTLEGITYLFPNTNRYVISSSSNIKVYNEFFKKIYKKYYVENDTNAHLVSFLRKNNKILFNYCNLNSHDKEFVNSPEILTDLLWNCEVFYSSKSFFEMRKSVFQKWPGNLILNG